MATRLRILILEDSPSDAKLLLRELRRGGYEVEHRRVDNAADMMAALESATWDVILSDYSMPGFSAPLGLKLMLDKGFDIPFIIVSGTVGEDTAVEAMKAGAHDFFAKNKLTRLIPAVEREVREAEERRRRHIAEISLQESEERYKSLVESSPSGIILQVAEQIVYVNPAAINLSGATHESALLGHSFGDFVFPADVESITQLIQQSDQAQLLRLGERKLRQLDGQELDVEILVSRVKYYGHQAIQFNLHDITERKQAEAALAQERQLLRTLIDNLPDRIYAKDAEGRYTLKNQADTRLMGAISPDEIIGKTDFDYYPMEIARQYHTDDRSVLHLGHSLINREEPFVDADGKHGWMLTSKVPLRDSQGHIIGLIGIGRDITKRKEAESELTALYNATSFLYRADSLANLGEQIAKAVVKEFSQADCGVLLLDKAHNRMIRLARAGSYTINPTTPLNLDEPSLVAEAVKTGQLIYAPNVRESPDYVIGDARTQSELVIPLRISEGIIGVLDLQSDRLDAFIQKDQRVLSVFSERAAAALQIMRLYDELNQRAAELEWRVEERTAQLNNAKNRIESILNSSSDMIILCYPDGTISQVNPSFDIMFGCRPDEMLFQPLISLVIPSHIPRLEDVFARALETQQPQRLELTIHYKEQVTFEADMVLSPVVEADEKLQGIVCSLRDITAHKEMERQLHQMLEEAMSLSELKTRYVSMAAHDLRHPLAVIQTSMDTIQHYYDRLTDEQKRAKFSQIQTQITMMVAMLDDILILGRVESGKLSFNPTTLDLVTFCQNLSGEVQLTSGTIHKIDFSSDGLCDAVNVDVNLLHHILWNLLSNAIKYSPEQSPVKFTVTCTPDWIVFLVQDQGIGIPDSEQAHLFEPFHRASNARQISGTGLGLVIVKQSVELHGGTFTFESKEGQGTTFTVTLPQTPLDRQG